MNTCKVENIEPIGNDGMYEATLGIYGLRPHGGCIKVIGATLTECVERTYIIVQAFKGVRK